MKTFKDRYVLGVGYPFYMESRDSNGLMNEVGVGMATNKSRYVNYISKNVHGIIGKYRLVLERIRRVKGRKKP
jgi:hypothetical protein